MQAKRAKVCERYFLANTQNNKTDNQSQKCRELTSSIKGYVIFDLIFHIEAPSYPN